MGKSLTSTGQCCVLTTQPVQLNTSFVPQAIAQTVTRITRSALLPDFSRGPIHRLVLSVIVGFSNKNNPGEPIYIRKTTLSGYIGRSLPQLRRYLADLEADGWIERH
jgi:hypothetical protein